MLSPLHRVNHRSAGPTPLADLVAVCTHGSGRHPSYAAYTAVSEAKENPSRPGLYIPRPTEDANHSQDLAWRDVGCPD